MRRDELLKRAFVVLVCFFLGAAAYFQAIGLMWLLDARLVADSNAILDGRPASPGNAGALAFRDGNEKSAAAILARNPFDSLTGPLDGMPKVSGHNTDVNSSEEGPCEGVRVMLITASDDPAWSFAAIAEGANRAVLRRVGDEIAGMSIGRIDWNSVQLVSNLRKRCFIALGEELKAGAKAGAGAISKALQENPNRASAASSVSGALPAEMAAKIKRLGEREVEIDRSLISDTMDRQGEVFAKLRITKVADGVRVMGIRPGSLLALMGVENGDELRSVNGLVISDPRSAMEAYMKLMKADHWVVNLGRRGQVMNLDVRIH